MLRAGQGAPGSEEPVPWCTRASGNVPAVTRAFLKGGVWGRHVRALTCGSGSTETRGRRAGSRWPRRPNFPPGRGARVRRPAGSPRGPWWQQGWQPLVCRSGLRSWWHGGLLQRDNGDGAEIICRRLEMSRLGRRPLRGRGVRAGSRRDPCPLAVRALCPLHKTQSRTVHRGCPGVRGQVSCHLDVPGEGRFVPSAKVRFGVPLTKQTRAHLDAPPCPPSSRQCALQRPAPGSQPPKPALLPVQERARLCIHLSGTCCDPSFCGDSLGAFSSEQAGVCAGSQQQQRRRPVHEHHDLGRAPSAAAGARPVPSLCPSPADGRTAGPGGGVSAQRHPQATEDRLHTGHPQRVTHQRHPHTLN